MAALWQDTRVTVLLADYASADAAGKINMIGAGYVLAGWDSGTNSTAPMHVAVIMDVAGRHAGEQFTFELELRDTSLSEVVSLPGPTGQSQALRVSQLALAERPMVPGLHLPQDVPCRVQLTLGFPNGLPLVPGHHYSWQLKIDGQRRPNWSADFFVPDVPKGPIFGGPAGPADIPGVEPSVGEVDEG